ncbi:MAG: MmgE/PrpD family protein [Chloroflexota bacterium]|jgi:2-methylcitrate dehydratase PrpD
MGVTQEIAQFTAKTTFNQLPPEVVRESKRAILNYLGVSLGASRHDVVRILTDAAIEMGGQPQASILGSGIKVSALQAALINGAMSHVLDYDDTHLDTIIHPTGPALSSALPLAEWKGLSGQRLITAFALGAEVELRIGAAVYPAHYDIGWHITGTAGIFGAAAAAASLLKLEEEQQVCALGLAGTQASGLREMFGYMAKSLHVGKAASNGLSSALLAQKGFTASKQVLEAKRGFCSVLAAEHDLSKAVDRLGEKYLFLENGIKPYACGVVIHPTIDGMRRLHKRESVQASQVREIELRVHPLVLELTGKREPKTALEGKFSIYFCAAIALIEGNARESQFTDRNVRRSDVVALMDRVNPVVDPGLKESQAEVRVRTLDGRELVERVEAASGTPENPLSDDELVDKVMDLVLPVLPKEKAEQMVEEVELLDKAENLSRLISLVTV